MLVGEVIMCRNLVYGKVAISPKVASWWAHQTWG